VYRARDSRLGRDVALKVLPDVFASGPYRLARFVREARTICTLNRSGGRPLGTRLRQSAGTALALTAVAFSEADQV
jgi:serine/threonine protein kinase